MDRVWLRTEWSSYEVGRDDTGVDDADGRPGGANEGEDKGGGGGGLDIGSDGAEPGGGGGGAGGAGGLCELPKAFRAACIAIDEAAGEAPLGRGGAEEGGGGGGADTGSLGADIDGGGGGALGGAGLADAGGGGGGGAEGAVPDGFRAAEGGGGGGVFPDPGSGGGARGGISKVDEGRDAGFGGGFRRFATNGLGAGESDAEGGSGGGRAPGGLGAAPTGGFGADAVVARGLVASESDKYEESLFAPVSTPPRLRSFGMPPANRPPNCGGPLAAPELLLSSLAGPVSLLLRNLFAEGIGGANPPGAFGIPGTGGAPPTGGPADLFSFPIMGADRSLVTAFLSFGAPLLISAKRALCENSQ